MLVLDDGVPVDTVAIAAREIELLEVEARSLDAAEDCADAAAEDGSSFTGGLDVEITMASMSSRCMPGSSGPAVIWPHKRARASCETHE